MTVDLAVSDLAPRLRAAGRLLDVAGPMLDEDTRVQLSAVVERARDRMAITGERTVVAVAGPTGVGKSSLVNALLDTDVATVGVTRPTTARPLALVVGDAPARELLRHVGVDRWEQLPAAPFDHLDGLVLVDLPDHDSVVTAHRQRADELVAVADRLLWVVDPEKYADASVHEDVLVPLRHHGVVLTAVLNRIDRVPADRVTELVADLRRVLREHGLGVVDVLAVSARTGEGLRRLRDLLGAVVAEKDAAVVRATADLLAVAEAVDEQVPPAVDHDRRSPRRDDVVDAALAAAGVPAVLDAAAAAHRHRARRATGWPPARRLQARGRDPLARLGLGRSRERGEVGGRSSRGVPHGIATATLARAVRERGEALTVGWPRRWAETLFDRLDAAVLDLPVALDRAVVATDLEDHRRPLWWSVVGGLQWLLVAGAVAGGLWLTAEFVLAWLQLPELPDPPAVGVVTWPTIALVGGAVLGLIVGAAAAATARIGAARIRRRLRRRLRDRVATVVDDRVHDVAGSVVERAHEAREQLGHLRR